MVQINFASREVNCKVVYYGPGRCGKTTNLQLVHAKAPPNSTGDLVSIATEADRTLYFDFLPLDLGTVAGMRTKFQLYTVPGQVYYDATRKLVLRGADGVVFVADSNPDMMNENIESLDNLAKNLRENQLDINDIPLVLQWNKRDLPNALPVAELNAKLNRLNWPTQEAVAVNGTGVFQTLKLISQQVIRRLNREQGFTEDGQRRAKGAQAFAAVGGAAKAADVPPRPGGGPKVPPPPAAAAPPKAVAPPPPRAAPPPPRAPKPPAAVSAPVATAPLPASAPVAPRPAAVSPPAAPVVSATAQALAAAPGPAAAAPPEPAAAAGVQKLNPVAQEIQRIRQRERERQASGSAQRTPAVTPAADSAAAHPEEPSVPGRAINAGAVLAAVAAVLAVGAALAWWFFLRGG